jgi:SulP family sulfate permease
MKKRVVYPSSLKTDISLIPFWKDIKKYQIRTFRDDLFAAFSVALLAIPQSMAYALLAGLPPSAGLFSAIFGVIFTSFFGSSKHLIAGPTTGVAILIQSTIAETISSSYPNIDPDQMINITMHILGQMILIMGLLQIIAGCFKFGKLLQFVSRSVVLGYFTGVIIAILVSQLFYFVGIPEHIGSSSVLYKAFYFFYNILLINWPAFILGVFGVVILIILKKFFPRFPNASIMLVIVSLISFLLNKWFISSNFLFANDWHIANLKDIGFFSRPSLRFTFFIFDLSLINKIFPACLAISLLSILEVFSVSRALAVKSGQNIHANQEIFGVGVANTFLSLITGSMPASGSLSRSALNFLNKAKTRFAGIFSGVIVAVFTFICWPLIGHVPITALAAILLVLAPSLIQIKEIKLCFTATRGDAVVFILTFVSCLIFSLYIAFFIGVIISIASYLRKIADPNLSEYAFNSSGRLMSVFPKKYPRKKIRIIGITGPLFFGVVDLLQYSLKKIAKDPYVKVIVLRLDKVKYIDASMCFAIIRLHEYLKAANRNLVISGLSEEVWNTLYKTKLVNELGQNNLFLSNEANPQLSTWRACLRAEELISD